MRTSYDSKKNLENDSLTSNITRIPGTPVEEVISRNLEKMEVKIDTFSMADIDEFDYIFSDGGSDALPPDFYKISKEVDKALELESINESYDEDSDSSSEEESITANEKQLNTIKKEEVVKENSSNAKKIIPYVASAVIIGGFVILGYKFISDNKGDSISRIERNIDKLYTSSRKEDVKNNVTDNKLSKYYEDLNEVKDGSSLEERQVVKDELDNISIFIADKGVLDKINDTSYQLNDSDMHTKLNSVKESVKGYSVDSLANTINKMISQIESDYSYYTDLRDELSLVKDYKTFDVDSYQVKINKVSHTENKKELQNQLNTIKTKIKVGEVVNDIKESAVEKVNKEVENAKESASEKVSKDVEEKAQSVKEDAEGVISNIIDAVKGLFSGGN